jgi:nicotinate-nucleotide adenylyltransferase
MKVNIGIYGGAFDPPHIGHLIIAEQSRIKFDLYKVIWIPLNTPSHKSPTKASASDRVKMVKLAIKDNPYFELSRIEIEREGKSYMIDTINELKNQFIGADFYLIIGMDEAKEFDKWKECEKIKEQVTIVVSNRLGVEYKLPKYMKELDVTVSASSTQIREAASKGESIKYLVPDKVREYIEENSLYLK